MLVIAASISLQAVWHFQLMHRQKDNTSAAFDRLLIACQSGIGEYGGPSHVLKNHMC